MRIQIKLKQAGKRRLVLEKYAIEIEDIGKNPTLAELITAVVTQQVAAYNAKTVEKPLMDFLTTTQIDHAAAVGKVSFGTIYNDKKADLHKAIQNAIEAHIDGLFVVALNDHIIEKLEDVVQIDEHAVFTFIRLTLLIG